MGDALQYGLEASGSCFVHGGQAAAGRLHRAWRGIRRQQAGAGPQGTYGDQSLVLLRWRSKSASQKVCVPGGREGDGLTVGGIGVDPVRQGFCGPGQPGGVAPGGLTAGLPPQPPLTQQFVNRSLRGGITEDGVQSGAVRAPRFCHSAPSMVSRIP